MIIPYRRYFLDAGFILPATIFFFQRDGPGGRAWRWLALTATTTMKRKTITPRNLSSRHLGSWSCAAGPNNPFSALAKEQVVEALFIYSFFLFEEKNLVTADLHSLT